MKNKKSYITMNEAISIQIAVKMRLTELIENKAKYAKALGKKSANSCYNPMIKETISAYRATKNIPIKY